MNHNPRIIQISSRQQAVDSLLRIGVEAYGIESMSPKMVNANVLLEGIESKVANILKQEMLSIGGDVAVARGTVDCSLERTDAIVIGTRKQIERFLKKLAHQPFGISKLAQEIGMCLDRYDRKGNVLKTSRREILISKPLIMGILNITPDSFSDGGAYADADAAVDRAIEMEAEGADIIDIGAESTRPGSEGIPLDVELERLVPVLKKINQTVKIPVSIDTTKAEIARVAADYGVEIINDISAMTADDRMPEIAEQTGMAVVLMHMRGTPKTMQSGSLAYHSLMGEIIGFLRERVEYAEKRGIDPDKIIIDPGIGFSKSIEDNLRILNHLREFGVIGKALLVGPSRKGFIGKLTGEDKPADRIIGTAVTVALAAKNGANIIRVHDVKQMKQAVDMACAVAGGTTT